MGIGIHLSLTLGKPVSKIKNIPSLVDQDGDFLPSFAALIYKSHTNTNFLKEVEKELNAQVEKILENKIKPDHINGQQHFHLIPRIYPIVKNISKKYKLKLRYPNEPFHGTPTPFNLIKYILIKQFLKYDPKPNNYHFYGLLYTGDMNKKVLTKIIDNLHPGVTEILLHPALYSTRDKYLFDKQMATSFMSSPNRLMEINALLNREIKNKIKRNNIILTTFSKI